MTETLTQQKVRTYISKTGDKVADRQIQEILRSGWKITCETPNGTVTIRTFTK